MYFQYANKPGRNSRGASLVEYALLIALISVVAIASVTSAGATIKNKLRDTGDCIGGDQTACEAAASGGGYGIP